MMLLVHGSGFDRPFKNDPQELRCGKPKEVRGNESCHWSPSSLDWAALGRSSGGSTGAATVDELLAVIRAQGLDSIEELRIIGHSNGAFIALGGTIWPDKVEFTEGAMIGDSLTFVSARSALRQLQNRFKADAQVVLAGCGSGGVGSDLLDFVSHAALRTVAGFTDPILYAIDGTTAGPIVKDKLGKTIGRRIDDDAKITVRGKAMYSKAANRIEDILGSDMVGTAVFGTNAWALVPDAKSKVGDIFDAVRKCKADPDAVSAARVGYLMIREFYAYRGYVPGIGFAANLVGLRVVEDEKIKRKMTLDLGQGFIDRITPLTLEQRVRELGQAIDLIMMRKPGVVPAK